MIKLIVFDIWETIAYRDLQENSSKTIRKTIKSQIPYPKFVKIFEKSLQTKKWDSKFDAYANLCKNIKLPVTDENVNLLMSMRDDAENKTKEYEYAIPMLKQLKDYGYKIGLISNSSVYEIEHLKEKTKILDYVDYPLFSFDVGIIKPNPKIFEKMLKISGYKPKEIIMIGDKLVDDVRPPRELGMNSLLFENYEQLKKDLLNFGIALE